MKKTFSIFANLLVVSSLLVINAMGSVGFLTQKTLPNGDKMVYTPNVRNQLKNVTSKNSANTVLQSFDYQLDNAGNRKKVTEAGGSYITWGYDNLYRLKSEIRYNSSNAITWQASLTYDAASNRNSMIVNGTTTNYTYNALDQLISAGSVTYNYDARGNQIKITMARTSQPSPTTPQTN